MNGGSKPQDENTYDVVTYDSVSEAPTSNPTYIVEGSACGYLQPTERPTNAQEAINYETSLPSQNSYDSTLPQRPVSEAYYTDIQNDPSYDNTQEDTYETFNE